MFRTDLLSIIRSLNTAFTANGICYTEILVVGKMTSVYTCMWGDPKIPGIVKKIYLKYLYKFETLVPFEVHPLRLDAIIPAPLPILETLSKIFNGNAVKGRQRFAGSP